MSTDKQHPVESARQTDMKLNQRTNSRKSMNTQAISPVKYTDSIMHQARPDEDKLRDQLRISGFTKENESS